MFLIENYNQNISQQTTEIETKDYELISNNDVNNTKYKKYVNDNEITRLRWFLENKNEHDILYLSKVEEYIPTLEKFIKSYFLVLNYFFAESSINGMIISSIDIPPC